MKLKKDRSMAKANLLGRVKALTHSMQQGKTATPQQREVYHQAVQACVKAGYSADVTALLEASLEGR